MSQPTLGHPSLVTSNENLVLGVIAGAVAAAAGAALWAGVTVATGYQIGWMAVGVGLLVGIAVRKLGKGSGVIYGIAGALLALAGCVAGNLLAAVGFFAQAESAPFFDVLGRIDPTIAVNVLVETASPMDLLFYGIAVYEGFKLSMVPAAADASPAEPGIGPGN